MQKESDYDNKSNKSIDNKKMPPISQIIGLNSLAKSYSFKQIPYQICEVCYKQNNLIICKICKCYYHLSCINLLYIPTDFICNKCKEIFNKYEPENINKYKMNSFTNIYDEVNHFPNSLIKNNENSINNDMSLVNGTNNNHVNFKLNKLSSSGRAKKDKKEREKLLENKDKDKEGTSEKDKKSETNSIKSNSKSINTSKSNNKSLTSKVSNKVSHSSIIGNKRKRGLTNNKKQNNNSIASDNNQNDNSISINLQKDINPNIYFTPTANKNKKNFINQYDVLRKEKEKELLSSYEHNDPRFKRRKIKVGANHNVDMYEFSNKYENLINFNEEEYERNDLKLVYSSSKNPLTNKEIDNYIKTARLFWNYRSVFLENELCSDFFEECQDLMAKLKTSEKLKQKINKLMGELKGLIRRGVDLNCHYDEMALKMLHICKYKTKIALLFLYKNLNPFIEEVEEGFKNDVAFFQGEIFSIINEGDIEIEE